MVLGVVEQRVGLRDPVRIMANFYTVSAISPPSVRMARCPALTSTRLA
jgi:hypothetical protein